MGAEETWVQVTEGEVNLAYPLKAEPTALLQDRLGDAAVPLTLTTWKPGVFATFARERMELAPLTNLVLQLFVRLLAVRDPDFDLDAELLRIPR